MKNGTLVHIIGGKHSGKVGKLVRFNANDEKANVLPKRASDPLRVKWEHLKEISKC